MEDLPDPIPAATLILMRDRASGPPELLMVERAGTMAFAAGALVFPGGRIDPGDHVAAALLAPGLEDGAARIAAVRETIEETGIAPALTSPLRSDQAAALRREVESGEPFHLVLDSLGLGLDPGALTPFARWCPNFREARRFDTLFYLAAAPARSIPAADQAETVRAFWATAAKVLTDIEQGRAHAIFPTRRNLERLAAFPSIEDAHADAERHPIAKIVPWVEDRGGQPFLCIPEDAGYPVTAEPLATARRR